METISALAAAKATDGISEVTKEGAKTFLGAVLKEPAVELGAILADKLRERRHSNLIKITARATKKLADAGMSPKAVPLSIIHPALESASLEEDPDLQEIWANLLANTADPRKEDTPHSFVSILKQMSSKEVRFLNAMYEMALEKTRGPNAHAGHVRAVDFEHRQIHKIFSAAGLARFERAEGMTYEEHQQWEIDLETDRHDAEMCMDSLRRHQLVIEVIEMDADEKVVKGSTRGISYAIPDNKYRLLYSYNFSHFGCEFVKACRPPEGD